MKKIILILLIMTINGQSIIAQKLKETDKKKNDLGEYNLKGEVKSLREFSYVAFEKLGEIIKGERKNDFEVARIFNKKGFCIEYYTYNSNEELNTKIISEFNNKDNIVETNIYEPDGTLSSKTTFKYDDNNNIIESYSYYYLYDNLMKQTNEYDINGNLIEHNMYSGFNDLTKNVIEYNLFITETYKYDEKGNQIEYNLGDSKWKLKYDDQGNEIESNIYDSTGNLEKKRTSKYDNTGNLIEFIKYNPEGVLEIKYNFKYEYDEKDNWVKMIEFENDKPLIITEREIEYY